MSKSIRGVIGKVKDKYVVKINDKDKPKRCKQKHFNILNIPEGILKTGDEIKCELICINKAKNYYKAYIMKVPVSNMKMQEFFKLAAVSVVNNINSEDLMFGTLFDEVDYETMKTRTRRREYVVARVIFSKILLDLEGVKIDMWSIADYLEVDRTQIYHYIKTFPDMMLDKSIKRMYEAARIEINTLYNQILQPNDKDEAALPYAVEIF